MLTEDNIMRMINQALVVFMTALGLKRSGKYNESLQVFNQAIEGILGLNTSLVNQLDDNLVLAMLTFQGIIDIDRVKVLADIYLEQSELYALLGQPDNNHFATKRSLRLYLEAFLASEVISDPELIKKIETLRIRNTITCMTIEDRLALLDYLDRLLAMNDDFLASAGLMRASLQDDLASIDRLDLQ